MSLGLSGVPAGVVGGHPGEPRPQGTVLCDFRELVRSGRGITRRHQEGTTTRCARDPTDRRGHDRQPGGERLEEHLGHPLCPRDVQEEMTLPVEPIEPIVHRDVPAKVRVFGHPEPIEPLHQLFLHWAVATDDQAPPRIVLAEQRQHVGEQQWVLLALQPADGENGQLVRVITALVGILDRGLIDQGDVDPERRNRMAVATLQVRPDDDDRMPPGKHPPRALEEEGQGAERAAAGVTARHISGKVLAGAEDDALPSQRPRQSEMRWRAGAAPAARRRPRRPGIARTAESISASRAPR